MRQFIVTGHGRKVGAIGIFYPFRATVESTSADQAAIDVYSQYEHITGMRVEDAPTMLISMQDIQRKHTGHWFENSTMRFFRSRVAQYGYQGPGGVYFVSSEQFNAQSHRLYSVRRQKADGSIETVGEFRAFKSRSGAHAAAKRYAKGDASGASHE